MYASAQGTPQNYNEAMKWYRLASDQGVVQAQYNLAVMYENGQGLARNEKEAIKWYRIAATQGFAKAQFNLGAMYILGDEKNYINGYIWGTIAKLNGHSDADKLIKLARSKISWIDSIKAKRISTRCLDSGYQQCDSL